MTIIYTYHVIVYGGHNNQTVHCPQNNLLPQGHYERTLCKMPHSGLVLLHMMPNCCRVCGTDKEDPSHQIKFRSPQHIVVARDVSATVQKRPSIRGIPSLSHVTHLSFVEKGYTSFRLHHKVGHMPSKSCAHTYREPAHFG